MQDVVSFSSKLKSFYKCSDYQFCVALGIALEMLDAQRRGLAPVACEMFERVQDLNITATLLVFRGPMFMYTRRSRAYCIRFEFCSKF